MIKKTPILAAFALFTIMALTACGGGGGTTSTASVTNTSNNPVPDPNPGTPPDTGTPTVTKPMAKINSVAFANNSTAALGGVYSLSAPGRIKLDYNVTFDTKSTNGNGVVYMDVSVSNSSTVSKIWNGSDFSEQLDSIYFTTNGPFSPLTGGDAPAQTMLLAATGLGGSDQTSNKSTNNMIFSYAQQLQMNGGDPSMVSTGIKSLDFTKPTYLLVTLYFVDPTIPVVFGVPSTYVSDQVALPITITP